MEGHNTTVDSNTDYSTNDPGYDYPQQPDPTTYFNEISGQPPYSQPNPATPRYYPAQSNQMSNNTVVVTQPASHKARDVKVQDSMSLAIFACLCCCWPLGLVAIFRANDSRMAIVRGDVESARRIAADSRKFSQIAILVGIVIFLCIIIAIIVPIFLVANAVSSTIGHLGYYSGNTYYTG